MNRFAQRLLLWLLMAALPLQGMAAVIKANCGPKHHTVSVSAPAESTMPAHHAQNFHEEHASSHGSDASNIAEKQLPANDASSSVPAQSGSHHASYYCSGCTTGCTGATAPPLAFSAISVPVHAEDVAIPPVVSYFGFIPPSLERPPKPFSA